MRSRTSVVLAALSLGALLLPTTPAAASFHLMQITEVFVGPPSIPGAQYVELTSLAGGQTQLQGLSLRLFDADGQQIAEQTFPSDMPGGSPAQSEILIASDGFTDVFTGVTRDFELEFAIPIEGGKVCFAGAVDCFAWGDYHGPEGGVGRPFRPPGLLEGSAATRRSFGDDGLPGAYDQDDDTNDSRSDFLIYRPTPRSTATGNNETGAAIGGVVEFELSQRVFDESEGVTPEMVLRSGSTSNEVTVDVEVVSAGAAPGVDYDPPSTNPATLTFPGSSDSQSVGINYHQDDELEPIEGLRLLLKNPTGGAVFGQGVVMNISILDDEPDIIRPESAITKPKRGETYRKLEFARGTAIDIGHGATHVLVGLRRNMTDGRCKWMRSGGDFVAGQCEEFRRFANAPVFRGRWLAFVTDDPLGSSRGTKIRSYTMFSRAIDRDGNRERGFENGSNLITFDIR